MYLLGISAVKLGFLLDLNIEILACVLLKIKVLEFNAAVSIAVISRHELSTRK